MSNTTLALVEDGASLGSRQLDMGNSGLEQGPAIVNTYADVFPDYAYDKILRRTADYANLTIWDSQNNHIELRNMRW